MKNHKPVKSDLMFFTFPKYFKMSPFFKGSKSLVKAIRLLETSISVSYFRKNFK